MVRSWAESGPDRGSATGGREADPRFSASEQLNHPQPRRTPVGRSGFHPPRGAFWIFIPHAPNRKATKRKDAGGMSNHSQAGQSAPAPCLNPRPGPRRKVAGCSFRKGGRFQGVAGRYLEDRYVEDLCKRAGRVQLTLACPSGLCSLVGLVLVSLKAAVLGQQHLV